MADADLRELQRAIQAGDDSLVSRFTLTLQRLGLKPKLRSYHTRELGLSVRPNFTSGTYAGAGTWMVVQRPKGKHRGEPTLWQCKHQHKTTKEAGKCAKRRGYCIIIHDEALLNKYIDINKSV